MSKPAPSGPWLGTRWAAPASSESYNECWLVLLNPPLIQGHREAYLENGVPPFLGFSFTSGGPSVLISISSVTIITAPSATRAPVKKPLTAQSLLPAFPHPKTEKKKKEKEKKK